MSRAKPLSPLVVDDEIRNARTMNRQRLIARTAIVDALVRARVFLERCDSFTTPEDGGQLLRELRRAGILDRAPLDGTATVSKAGAR